MERFAAQGTSHSRTAGPGHGLRTRPTLKKKHALCTRRSVVVDFVVRLCGYSVGVMFVCDCVIVDRYMYLKIYMYLHTYISIYISLFIYIYFSLSLYKYINLYKYTDISVCVCVCVCVCVFVCLCVCVFVLSVRYLWSCWEVVWNFGKKDRWRYGNNNNLEFLSFSLSLSLSLSLRS